MELLRLTEFFSDEERLIAVLAKLDGGEEKTYVLKDVSIEMIADMQQLGMVNDIIPLALATFNSHKDAVLYCDARTGTRFGAEKVKIENPAKHIQEKGGTIIGEIKDAKD